MPERSSKRKAMRDSPASSIEEPKTDSQRTESVPSISDKGFRKFPKEYKNLSGR